MKYYLLILLAILPSSVFARQTPDSTRVFTEEHPLVYEDAWDLWPYSFLNENGDAVGYNIDLLRMLCKELDIPYVVKLKPTQDALNDLKDGHADLMCGMDAHFHNDYAQYGESVIRIFTHSVLHQVNDCTHQGCVRPCHPSNHCPQGKFQSSSDDARGLGG